MIFSKFMLDKVAVQWYYNRARIGKLCVHCDDAGDCALKSGNFCGVCPVIGRLNCFCLRCVYRCGRGKVGLVSAIFLGSE